MRSDRDDEYEILIGELCAQHEIINEVTPPYSPQYNCVVERTFKKMINAMLISSRLPQNIWGQAILLSDSLLNRIMGLDVWGPSPAQSGSFFLA